jgi:hypothetical protein
MSEADLLNVIINQPLRRMHDIPIIHGVAFIYAGTAVKAKMVKIHVIPL